MKVEYINPFIESVYELFQTMLKSRVERTKLTLASDGTTAGDITALVGLSGLARGTVALSFPMHTAQAVVGQMLSIDPKEVAESVPDGVAELVNMVAGGAKAKFHVEGDSIIELGLPTVVRGGDFVINYPSHASWLDIGFTSGLGPFSLRVTFDLNKKDAAT